MSESCEEYCDVHEHRIRKARKQHRCCACRAVIRPGDYYASVFTLSDDGVATFKRCGSCETTWQHLWALCKEHNKLNNETLYPHEDLGCGLKYEDEWAAWGPMPEHIAAAPFLSSDERGELRGGVLLVTALLYLAYALVAVLALLITALCGVCFWLGMHWPRRESKPGNLLQMPKRSDGPRKGAA